MKKFILLLLILTGVGCINPQAQALRASYERGEISASDYHNHRMELEAIQSQERQHRIQMWQQYWVNKRPQTIYIRRLP